MADEDKKKKQDSITGEEKEKDKSAKEQVEEIANKVKQETEAEESGKEEAVEQAAEETEEEDESTSDAADTEAKDEEAADDKSEKAEEENKESEEDEKEEAVEEEVKGEKENEAEVKEEQEETDDKEEEVEEGDEESVEEKKDEGEEKKEEEPKEENKKKKGFLFFGKGKKKKDKKKAKKQKEMTPEEVADTLDKQIRQARESEYLVLRIRKRTVLLLLGLGLVALWLTPVMKIAYQQYQAGELQLDWMPESLSFIQQKEVEAEVEEENINPDGLQVRILTVEEYRDQVQALASKLEEEGTYVEVVFDDAKQTEAVEIVVKPNDDGTRADLTNLLATDYELASPSAELTVDSDFDAVILYGEPAETEE